MKAMTLMNTLDQLNDLTKSLKTIKESRKEKYISQLNNLYSQYEKLEIPTNLSDVYDSLCSKGKELIKEIKNNKSDKKNGDNIEVYIRYLKAAKADFEGRTEYVNKYYRSFIFTAILFLGLSPQYFGFILPAVFFVPMYLGIKGVKSRSINGLYMSMSLVPVGLMTSFIWIRYGVYAMANYQEAVNKVITDTGRGLFTAKALVTIPPILACVLLLVAITQLYRGYKSKDLFV